MSSANEEVLLWRGTPSQWTNLGAYFVCLLLAAGIVAGWFFLPPNSGLPFAPSLILVALALPALIAFFKWLGTRCHIYEITSERIKVTTGIVSRHSSELELYRVRDYSVVQPLTLRIIGRGNIVLATSDRTNPQVVLHAVPQPESLKDQIRAHTERMRQRRGVRDLEVDTQ